MGKIKEMMGLSFGYWIVLREDTLKGKSKEMYWICECSCGNVKSVSGVKLRAGGTTKCQSCSSKENGRIGLYAQSRHDPVYFIRCGDYVKIGTSKNIQRRLKDLETGNPYPLELIYVEDSLMEEEWHVLFKHRHHRGEWYLFDGCRT